MGPVVELTVFLFARPLLTAECNLGPQGHLVIARRPDASLPRTPTPSSW